MLNKYALIFMLLLIAGAYTWVMVMASASLPEEVALAIVVPLIGLVVYIARKLIAMIHSSSDDDDNNTCV